MPRIMSCAETTQAVLDETKTVTRRLGWWEDRRGRRLLKPGDELSLVAKAMGRKPGEPLVRLALVEVVDVRREPLDTITDEDVHREGVVEQVRAWRDHCQMFDYAEEPGDLGLWFPIWYRRTFGCERDATVTRIEWRYLDPVGRCFFGPGGCSEPYVEWDDGKERPLRLVPDHLRHLTHQEVTL